MFLKEMLKKDVGLQYLLIYLVSLIGTFGASPEPDAMHPKALRPTNDPVSTQLQLFPAGRTTARYP